MRVLDIDMDFFLFDIRENGIIDDGERWENIEISYSEGGVKQIGYYTPKVWDRDSVINYLENNLHLSKQKKIPGRIVKKHNEAILFFEDMLTTARLESNFKLVHVDSHADLGLNMCSKFIENCNQILKYEVEKRFFHKMLDESGLEISPNEADYLLYIIMYGWISELIYVYNDCKNNIGNDYDSVIFLNGQEPKFYETEGLIALAYNPDYPSISIDNEIEYRESVKTVYDAPTKFTRVKCKDYETESAFDFLLFAISPSYTPSDADFIIDIIKEYIIEV